MRVCALRCELSLIRSVKLSDVKPLHVTAYNLNTLYLHPTPGTLRLERVTLSPTP